jgi:hypothetical protein
MLPRCRALKVVVLAGNRIGPAGCEVLAGALPSTGITTLSLAGNGIGSAGAAALAAMFECSDCGGGGGGGGGGGDDKLALTSLDLSDNRLGRKLRPGESGEYASHYSRDMAGLKALLTSTAVLALPCHSRTSATRTRGIARSRNPNPSGGSGKHNGGAMLREFNIAHNDIDDAGIAESFSSVISGNDDNDNDDDNQSNQSTALTIVTISGAHYGPMQDVKPPAVTVDTGIATCHCCYCCYCY